jgi:hypothetical protein
MQVIFPTLANFFQVHLYDDVSWVESWRVSAGTLAGIRCAQAVLIAAALKYNLFIFYQKGLVSRFVFYLTNLSCGGLVIYLASMAALGWRDSERGLDRRRAKGWSGWLLHQLYVLNCCLHPIVCAIFWSMVIRPHHLDSVGKIWKEVTLHGLTVFALLSDFYLSNRTFISVRDVVIPNAVLFSYGAWMEVGGLLHPQGGRNGGPWFPYPEFAPGSAFAWLYYAGMICAVNVVFFGVYRAHVFKARRLNALTGWHK